MTASVVFWRAITIVLALSSFYRAGIEFEKKNYPRFFLELCFGLIFLIVISSWLLKLTVNINNF